MKIISIWNPYATLIVHGYKAVETRSWKAPLSLIGQRIGIASTKRTLPEQLTMMGDAAFATHYGRTFLSALPDLVHGAILGTATLHSCAQMTEEDIQDVTEEEKVFGVWEAGRYAWRLRSPQVFAQPIFTRGFQGIWDYEFPAQAGLRDQARPPPAGRSLRLVEG